MTQGKMPCLSKLHSLAILILGMIICGFISIYFGKDIDYDVANYHYYNPYAFLHHRWHLDYWPPSYIHLYFSPIVDFISYFLIQNFSPLIVTFLMGAIHGINFWLLFCIARSFLFDSRYSVTVALLLAALGMYGGVGFYGVGDFKNDHVISIFILCFVIFYLKMLKQYVDTKVVSIKWVVLANLMLGVASGLKLTAMLFVVGAGFSCILLPFSIIDRLKVFAGWAIAVALGYSLVSGYWSLHLWQNYHNPLFPFFNNIFNPLNASLADWHFTKYFGMQGAYARIFFPVYTAFFGASIDNSLFRDYRFLAVYLLLLALAVRWLWIRFSKKPQMNLVLTQYWFFLFFVFSYIVDVYCFSSVRYMLALEMLAPLCIYLLLKLLIKDTQLKFAVSTIVLSSIALTLIPCKTVTLRERVYRGSYFNIKLSRAIDLNSKAIVLMAYGPYALQPSPEPQTFLIPFFPKQWHYIGVPVLRDHLVADTAVIAQIKQRIDHHNGIFYLVTTKRKMVDLIRIAKGLGLVVQGECDNINSDRQVLDVSRICIARKLHT